MSREDYWRSKIPIPLVLLFLVNLFFIVAVELLVIYKYPAKPDAAILGKMDASYADCTILSSDESGYLGGYLVRNPDGSTHLIVIKSHPVFIGRAKFLHAEPILTDENGDQIIYVKNGIHTSEVAITGGDIITIRYGYGGSTNEAAAFYLVLGAVLEGLELAIWHLIKHGS